VGLDSSWADRSENRLTEGENRWIGAAECWSGVELFSFTQKPIIRCCGLSMANSSKRASTATATGGACYHRWKCRSLQSAGKQQRERLNASVSGLCKGFVRTHVQCRGQQQTASESKSPRKKSVLTDCRGGTQMAPEARRPDPGVLGSWGKPHAVCWAQSTGPGASGPNLRSQSGPSWTFMPCRCEVPPPGSD
jgi:hypothetical protein